MQRFTSKQMKELTDQLRQHFFEAHNFMDMQMTVDSDGHLLVRSSEPIDTEALVELLARADIDEAAHSKAAFLGSDMLLLPRKDAESLYQVLGEIVSESGGNADVVLGDHAAAFSHLGDRVNGVIYPITDATIKGAENPEKASDEATETETCARVKAIVTVTITGKSHLTPEDVSNVVRLLPETATMQKMLSWRDWDGNPDEGAAPITVAKMYITNRGPIDGVSMSHKMFDVFPAGDSNIDAKLEVVVV